MARLDKKEFVEVMDKLKKFWDFENDLNTLIYERCENGYIFFPNIINATISVLSKMFDDKTEDINYFVWELCFGRKWEPGTIKDNNGNDICWKTAGDLYDYLITGVNDGK